MATKDSNRNAGSDGIGSPAQAAVILLAMIIAMGLAVVNVLVLPESAAVAPHRSLLPEIAMAVAIAPVDARRSPPVDPAGQALERTNNWCECEPGRVTALIAFATPVRADNVATHAMGGCSACEPEASPDLPLNPGGSLLAPID